MKATDNEHIVPSYKLNDFAVFLLNTLKKHKKNSDKRQMIEKKKDELKQRGILED